jgi:DNA-binding CsgD family transcriptional regulator
LLAGKTREEIMEELNIQERMYFRHCKKIKEKIKN